MKKVILATVIAFATAISINNKALANTTTGSQEASTTIAGVKNVKEIEIHGNVKVYLTSSETDSVKVYDDYYAQNALVQEQDNILRITSYSAKQLVVWVSVYDLAKLSVFDNAEVKSFGKFSALDLKVNLYNHASAQLNVAAITASVSLSDRASADLTGDVDNGIVSYDRSASVNTYNLTAANLTETIKQRPAMKHFHHVDRFSI